MIMLNQCGSCKHFHGLDYPDENGRFPDKVTCDAFPNGIPQEIYSDKIKHTKPYPGDNGIQYEPWGIEIEDDNKA